jgi:hypothetical protein
MVLLIETCASHKITAKNYLRAAREEADVATSGKEDSGHFTTNPKKETS